MPQMPDAKHRTLRFKRLIAAPPERVFRALSRAKEKALWSAPKGDEIRFQKSDFKFGGVETFRCGPKGALNFQGTLHFEDIIKNKRIVFTETVFFEKQKLATALVTTELTHIDQKTLVTMTIQVVSYCGDQMLKGYASGYKMSLKNLKDYLKSS